MLVSLYRKFLQESNRILGSSLYALRTINLDEPGPTSHRQCIEMGIIRLYDSWARFCRQLVILSAGARATTASGVRLPLAPNIARIRDVVPVLLTTYRRRRFEPNWALATDCIDAARRLRVSNLPTIQAAIGSTNSPANEVRIVSNFYAHRSKLTAFEISNLSWWRPFVKLNVENIAGAVVTGGVTRFESWIKLFTMVGEASIQ